MKRILKVRRCMGVRYGVGCKYFLDDNVFVIKQNIKLKL